MWAFQEEIGKSSISKTHWGQNGQGESRPRFALLLLLTMLQWLISWKIYSKGFVVVSHHLRNRCLLLPLQWQSTHPCAISIFFFFCKLFFKKTNSLSGGKIKLFVTFCGFCGGLSLKFNVSFSIKPSRLPVSPCTLLCRQAQHNDWLSLFGPVLN